MIKGKYKIRKNSPAYWAVKANRKMRRMKKPLAMSLMVFTLFGMTVYATKMDVKLPTTEMQAPIEVAHATSETKIRKPETLYRVVAYHDGNDVFTTEDGESWCYVTGEKYDRNAKVVLTLSDNGTENYHDDIITEIELAPKYYDVPLSHELQEYIIDVCAEYPSEINGVHLELVLAMIEKESSYNHNSIGDNGEAFGLMQVQPKWHQARMAKFGVTDLLDPYQNVRVGIDYLAECLGKYETLDEALTVYNAGPTGAEKLYFSKGTLCSPYASDVLDNWREICLSVCQ